MSTVAVSPLRIPNLIAVAGVLIIKLVGFFSSYNNSACSGATYISSTDLLLSILLAFLGETKFPVLDNLNALPDSSGIIVPFASRALYPTIRSSVAVSGFDSRLILLYSFSNSFTNLFNASSLIAVSPSSF